MRLIQSIMDTPMNLRGVIDLTSNHEKAIIVYPKSPDTILSENRLFFKNILSYAPPMLFLQLVHITIFYYILSHTPHLHAPTTNPIPS
ncbi:hypothetical protein L5515_005983 [Caenorhabditis briggsae]|uniref:Uncharacterized protein n=1 Tax=Caenorhabditis briggsae TaxID=6238 RepID=A0AAE9JIX7_CAEBR|nr:hypothetical protein L3Y34_006153 [Caenorhabditis briggsae]UMM32038.1 hypothetical protein L5515_005983 [Caenorhabditis briggsae]